MTRKRMTTMSNIPESHPFHGILDEIEAFAKKHGFTVEVIQSPKAEEPHRVAIFANPIGLRLQPAKS